MRHAALALIFAALLAQGCASHDTPKPETSPHTQTSPATAPTSSTPFGPVKLYTIQSGGQNILRLSAPVDAPCTLADGSFDMRSRDGYVNIWLIRNAKTIAEGVQRVPAEITSEFKDFNATSTSNMTAPVGAVRLLGTGVEADDNDPGKADIIVFQQGGRVFIACTHGESMRSSAQELMANLVQTATAP